MNRADKKLAAVFGAFFFLLPVVAWWLEGWNWPVLFLVALPSWWHVAETAIVLWEPEWLRRLR